MLAVPLAGLHNRPPSLGGERENQQFSKSHRAGDFHSEKTKLMKALTFQLLVTVICPQYVSVSCSFFSALPQRP